MQQMIFKLERKLIFDAALDLIKQGRFHDAPISELSFHAKLTEGTTRLLFDSKEHIVTELYDYASNRLHEIINQVPKANGSFENEFIGLWVRLYEYYILDSRMLTFMEHHQSQLFKSSRPTQKTELLAPLIRLFANHNENVGLLLRPEFIVHFLCASVITHVKLHVNADIEYDRQEAIKIAKAWWRSLQYEREEKLN